MKKILIPIEINETTQNILDKSVEILSNKDCEVCLLHIVENNDNIFTFNNSTIYSDYKIYEVSYLFNRDEKAKILKDDHIKFTEFVNQLNEKGIKTKGLFIAGSIEKAIEAKIEKLNIDLIILGKQKKGKFMSLFSNNTAQKVIDSSSIPVLIVPIV